MKSSMKRDNFIDLMLGCLAAVLLLAAATPQYWPIGPNGSTSFGLVADARAYGISPYNSDAQNQTDFAALAAAVNAGTAPAHVYLPAPAQSAITAWSIASNNPTFTVPNNYAAGMVILVRGFGTSNFFNNVPFTVTSATSTQFTGTNAAFTHANGSATEAGIGVPEYNVLSTGSTSLGVYNVAIDFECDSPDSTIVNQTGTGYLLQPGPSGYVEFTNVNFWSPSTIHKCQFTGGASAAGGIYYPAGADGLVINLVYFYNWGSASNWAITSTGSNELEVLHTSYMRTDNVAGNFVRQPLTFYNFLWMFDDRIVCTASTTNGASVACGTGVWASGNLEAQQITCSGPVPCFLADGAGGNGTTVNISESTLEGAGSYLIEYGLPSASGNQYTYNFNVKNNRVELNGTNFGFVGPANATYSGLNTADISHNTLRQDATTTLPAIILNNIGGQGHLQALGNIGWAYVHNIATNIPPFTIDGLANDGSVVLADSGAALTMSSALGLSNDAFAGSTLQPQWVITGGSFTVGSNQLSGNSSGATSLAYWNGGNFPSDQWAEVVTQSTGSTSEIGVGVRLQSGSASGYVGSCSSTACGIYKVTSGTRTLLGGSTIAISVGGGADIRVSSVGTLLTLYVAGIAVQTATDATYGTGQPGIEAFGNSGTTTAQFWDAPGPLYKSNAQGYYTGYGTATFASGAGAGTGPGTPSCFSGYGCDSKHGVISMSTGSATPTSGTVLTITLGGSTRPTKAVCTVVAMNTTTGALTPLYTANSTTTSCVGSAPGVALTASQAYAFSYTVD